MKIPVGRHPVLPYMPDGSDVEWISLAQTALDEVPGVVAACLARRGKRFAIGGYGEDREFYRRSPLFRDAEGRYRSVHLGVDVWAPAGTPVFVPCPGRVHSWGNHTKEGDYGGTIVLAHEGIHSLYGHLAPESLEGLYEGMPVEAGQLLAVLGDEKENGGWEPHLHFQLIEDFGEWRGDYPGVALREEAEQWLRNCPDPNRMLRIPAA